MALISLDNGLDVFVLKPYFLKRRAAVFSFIHDCRERRNRLEPEY